MKKQVFNPYLPSWEYIPDGEPRVFNGRVYVFGSHDRFNGYAFCLNDYVCWSAPEDDLKQWRYEGVIYRRNQDPKNPEGKYIFQAPDVVKGPDGRYYLYYVMGGFSVVSVAVCDTPAGEYEFYGYVHYADGTLLGEKEGDQPQFDPGVLEEDGKVYLYTGFCTVIDDKVKGATVTVLKEDMLTVSEDPVVVAPGKMTSAGTSFEGHEFFEAASIRKVEDKYFFIYSSVVYHELCYAVSDSPTGGFVYKGVLVSNNDSHISTYKPAEKPMFYGGNNHGSIAKINGEWYIFYHRQTNGTSFSRQGCAEKLKMNSEGGFEQAEMTSCGLNGGPLEGKGMYPAYIACNLFCPTEEPYSAAPGEWMDARFPKITQDGKDGDEEEGYIANMKTGATAGFKYFDCKGIHRITIRTRGFATGKYYVKTAWDGERLGSIDIDISDEWKAWSADISIPDGVHALYFEYEGMGNPSLASFELE